MLSLAARLLGGGVGLDGCLFRAPRPLRAHVGESGSNDGDDRERDATTGNLARTYQRMARGELARLLIREQPLGRIARLAFLTQVAATLYDAAEHVVRKFDPPQIQALFNAEQATIHQQAECAWGRTGRGETVAHALFGHVLAKTRFCQQLVLDHSPDGGRLVGERALVEITQDAATRAVEQVERDFAATLHEAGVVELAADETQQRRLDLGVGKLGATGDEAHDRRRDFLGHQPSARTGHCRERLCAGHRRESQAVLGDARHRRF